MPFDPVIDKLTHSSSYLFSSRGTAGSSHSARPSVDARGGRLHHAEPFKSDRQKGRQEPRACCEKMWDRVARHPILFTKLNTARG